MKPKYSIIIPTKNEEEAIAKVLCSIPEKIKKDSEIIVVDSSNDLTPKIAERLGAKVIRTRKGKGGAMSIGVEQSKGDILIFLDGDGTDPPQYIPMLLKKLRNSNLVLGCRSMKSFKTDDPMMRRFFKIYASLSVRPLFRLVGFKTKGDPLAGFRAIRRCDWDRLDLKSEGFEIEAEMNIKAVKNNFIIKEVPIPHLKRGGGFFKSKLATNPKMCLKIINFVIKHAGDEKIKNKLKTLRKNLRIKIEKLIP